MSAIDLSGPPQTPARPRTPSRSATATAAVEAGWRRVRPPAMALIGIVLALVMLFPYVIMILGSLRTSQDNKTSPASFLPREWQWDTYSTIVADERFVNWFTSSLIIAGASTLIVIVIAIPAAYVTARYRFKGRMAFLFLILITQMFAPTSLVVGLYRQFFDLNMVDTYGALILTNAAFNLAFAVWILNGFFSAIPREIEEAAQLDGVGRMGILLRIMLPLAAPGAVTAIIFTFIAAWNEYVVALTLIISDERKPLTVGMRAFVTGYEQHWDQLFAAATLTIIPVAVLFVLIEKHLIGGLTAGSVK